MPNNWPEILAFYREMRVADMEPAYQRGASAVADVAEYIASTWLQKGLFAYTSHYALCLHQTDQSPLEARPILRIEPLRISDKVEFRLHDTWREAKQWRRVVSPEEVMPRFVRTLSQLHWISDAALMTLPPVGSMTSEEAVRFTDDEACNNP